MGIKDGLFNFMAGGYIRQQIKQGLREALPGGGGIDADEHLYRKLTGNISKDLSPIKQERVLQIAYHLYDTNPLAHRICELTKDFVVGEGITYEAKDIRVKQLLDEFWNDPVNLWDLKQHQKALELGLYGEQCYTVAVNEYDGRVRLGYIDPLQIDEVITDPDNCEIITGIKLKGTADRPGRTLSVVQLDEDPQSDTYGYLVGECFFFKVNSVSNSSRGRSDLLSLADWLSGYDEFLFNRLDRAALINAFVWDITLKGLTQEEIERWLQNTPPPKPGSIRAHNENVQYQAVVPKLEAHDATNEARMMRNHILGGAGFPEHWFAEGGNVNRATAAEMSEPTIKRLSTRQRYFRYMLEHIFRFCIDQALIHRRLPREAELEFSVIMPEISLKDISALTASLKRVSDALQVAEDQGWVSRRTAARLFGVLAARLGVDIDVERELADREE
jgi:hypothetical protein